MTVAFFKLLCSYINRYISANVGMRKSHRRIYQGTAGGFAGFARLFSQQYQIYATVFWGRGKEFQGDNILTIKGSVGVDKPLVKNKIRSIRQLPIGKLTAADMNAFGGIGFIHHIQIFPFCRIQFVD